MYYSKPREGIDELLYNQHKERIKNIKKIIDNNEPKKKKIIDKFNIEKRQIESKIDYENKLMLERIAINIQKSNIDNKLSKEHKIIRNFTKKLNKEKNRRKSENIYKNNKELLRKIIEVKPEYDHLKWEDEYKEHNKKMQRMLVYPEIYNKRYTQDK